MAEETKEKTIDGIDVGNATSIVRKYLEENYGNIGMLLFRVEYVKPNTAKNQFIVLCSLLNSIGGSKRLYYLIKVDISNGAIIDVYRGEETSKGIVLNKVLPEE